MTDRRHADKTADEVKEEVLAVAQRVHAAGLVVATAGNISGRMPGGDTVCMTPSSLPYEGMTVGDLVVVDLDGEIVDGGETGDRTPSTEKALHLECYRRYPEVNGVIHSHAPYASMFALVREPIPAAIEEVVVYLGGDVPICEYRTTGTDELGDIGYFVHETDLGGQHGVGGVFGQFGRAGIHGHDAIVVAVERGVHATQCFDGIRAVGAQDDAIRAHAVFNGSAFLEEFGVGDDVERNVCIACGQFLGDGCTDFVGGAHGYGGFVDDHGSAFDRLADAAGHGQHVFQVGAAVFVGWCAHGDEDHLAVGDGVGGIGGETQAAFGVVGFHHGFQTGFVDRHDALVEAVDLGGINIHAADVVADFRQTGAGDEADVAGSKDGEVHGLVVFGG